MTLTYLLWNHHPNLKIVEWILIGNLFFFLIAGNFVADENGSTEPLRSYKDKTLVIVLPGDLTVFDIEW